MNGALKMNVINEMKKYEKCNDLDNLYYHPVLFPKILSFDIKKIFIAELMSILSFHISETGNKILFKCFCDNFNFKELQKYKNENSNQDYKYVFEKIKNHFNLSQKEFNEIKHLIEKQIENKNVLFNILLFFGAPTEIFKKYKFDLQNNFSNKKEQTISLKDWL
jgi:hypothetical protein